jgi:hypothetical protein
MSGPEVFVPGEEGWPFTTGGQTVRLRTVVSNAYDIAGVRRVAREVEGFLRDPDAQGELLSTVETTENTYLQGLVLSVYDDDSLPLRTRRALSVGSRNDVEATPLIHHKEWTLCDASEERMVAALSEGTTMLIGGLMVKFRGRIAAFCFDSFATNTGTFVKGNFYSPDEETQKVLKQEFVEGNNIPESPGNFILMRGLRSTGGFSDLFSQCRQRADNMPKSIPAAIKGMSRVEYYEKQKEMYSGDRIVVGI